MFQISDADVMSCFSPPGTAMLVHYAGSIYFCFEREASAAAHDEHKHDATQPNQHIDLSTCPLKHVGIKVHKRAGCVMHE